MQTLAMTGSAFDRTGVAFRPFELRGLQLGLRLPSLRDTVASPNVVAVVEGKDARLRQEYVVVSAHLDHLGTLDGRIYNGANDDASGSAVVLSLARAIAADPPRRSVIFALFTAEEHGLIGSRYFVLNPPVPLRAIKAEPNLDQVGRLPNGGLCDVAGPESMGAAIWASLGTARPLPVRFTADTSSHGIHPSSDLYSFHRAGVPAIVLGCAGYPEWHRPGDDAALIRPELLAGAARFAHALTMKLANQ